MIRERMLIAVLLMACGLVQAATWTGAVSEWLNTNAWDTADIPNSVGEFAVFGDSSEYNVDIQSGVIVGRNLGTTITVDGTGSYTFGGDGALIIRRLAAKAFANDVLFKTTGDTVFNVPVTSTRNTVGTIANRFRANAGCGDVIFNEFLFWSNTSLQLYHDSSNGRIEINGGMLASTANKELWLWTSQPSGISVNSTISSSVSSTRITIANGTGSVCFSNSAGVAAGGSLDKVAFNAGTLELGEDNQIATMVALAANSGTFDLNGHNNTNSTVLNLLASTAATLTFDFSDPAGEALYFNDCSTETWNADNLLDLVGFEFGVDELRFGTGANALTPTQVSKIRVDGAVVDNLALDGDGFLTTNAVPPILATWAGTTNSWMSTNAWDTATVPASVGDGVVFGDSGEYSVEIDSAVSLGRADETTFSVEGSGSYTFSGDGSLKIERGTANKFVNGDLYLTTSGDTVFNLPLAVARTEPSSLAVRIRTDSAAGDVTFNQPVTWTNASLQIRNDSESATMTFNGAMTGGSMNQELWVSAPLAGGTIALNNVISATTNNVRVTIAAGDGIVQMANPSGVVMDSSMDFLSFIGGTVELGAGDQIASDVKLYSAGGGTLDMNGFSNQNAATLALASADEAVLTIDFSDASAESLCFSDSSAVVWEEADVLNLSGFVFGTDSLRFGTDGNGLTEAQLSLIQVDGESISGLRLDSNGFLALPTVGTVGSEMVSGGTGLALTWENTDGVSYSVQTNDDLVSGEWGVLQSNLTGVGSSLSYTGTVSDAQLFFRIIQE